MLTDWSRSAFWDHVLGNLIVRHWSNPGVPIIDICGSDYFVSIFGQYVVVIYTKNNSQWRTGVERHNQSNLKEIMLKVIQYYWIRINELYSVLKQHYWSNEAVKWTVYIFLSWMLLLGPRLAQCWSSLLCTRRGLLQTVNCHSFSVLCPWC